MSYQGPDRPAEQRESADESDLDFGALTVVQALPHARYLPEGEAELFASLAGARILQLGSPAEQGIEGGGLVLDYVPHGADQARRVVFGFNENGMWIEYQGAHSANRV